jgi:hypothetical protein
MSRISILKQLFSDSLLSEVFSIRKEDEYKEFSSLRFKSNEFRLRAIELWDHTDGQYLRIYYAPEMAEEIKAAIGQIEGKFKSIAYATDFRGDFINITKRLHEILVGDAAKVAAKANPVLAKSFGYEGLELPDVDTSESEIFGRIFTWKEILAIYQDDSAGNELKKSLSRSGVYLQRSKDGKARYVGSAYGDGGFIARWMKHLGSNGNAKHLNFFVLENGYNDIVFTVLEITPPERALGAESRWKSTLGSNNSGPYDGFRLNCN